MKTPVMIFFLLFSLASAGQTDAPVFGKQQWINGYASTIEGEVLPYFSVYPNHAREALLTRCTDGKKQIAWNTSVIPHKTKGKYAYFSWIAAHSSGTSSGERFFDLFINDSLALTFSTKAKQYPGYWTFGSSDSTRIVFEFKTKDGADDSHGIVYLRVPLKKYGKGKALRIRVTGHAQSSNDWYMTFRYAFTENAVVCPMPFLLADTSNRRQPLRVTVLHFGENTNALVSVNGASAQAFPLHNGFNVCDIPVKAAGAETKTNVKISIGKLLELDTTVTLLPVQFREIDLIHHAHTDIGYSHIQEEVQRIHVQNIRRALRLIERTKNYPEESRFKWNIESAWAVENFLNEATETEKKQFAEAVKQKQMLISATYCNVLTGLSSPEEMQWIIAYAKSLRDTLGLPVNSAMMSDIPGMSWSMIDVLAQNGIRYFSNGPNYVEELPDHGDRIGHTLRAWGDKPFWWKSQSGRDSILYWTCGRGYSSWHRFTEGAVADRGTEKIAAYLHELDTANYPYAIVQWRYNIVADNGPTDSTIADFVKSWNEKYASPKLVLATVDDVSERFVKRYGASIPAYSGDFTPYWEDGAYSTAAEEGENRMLSEKLLLLQNIAAQKKIRLDPKIVYQAQKYIVLFHEHTWGSWNSISDPDLPFTTHQWQYKKAYIDSSRKYIAAIENIIRQNIATDKSITVINTLNWPRSGTVLMPRPAWFTGNVLIDPEGIHHDVEDAGNGMMRFSVLNISACGEQVLKPGYDRYPKKYGQITFTGPPVQTLPYPDLDQSNTKLVSPFMNIHHYHSLKPGLWPMAICSRGIAPPVEFRQKTGEWKSEFQGPASASVSIDGTLEGCDSIHYTFINENGYWHVRVTIDKKAVREKESIHIALPFVLDSPELRVGSGDGFYTAGKDQLPGSNHEFYSVQRWIDLSGDSTGFTLVSPQGALFECGKIIDETRNNRGYKYWKDSAPVSSTLYLYALNNYWHTNYKSDQQGKISFDIYIMRHKAFNLEESRKFGYEVTQPVTGF